MHTQDRHTDQLQRPKHYPEPVVQYTLKEMTVIWHMYGGRDFQPPSSDLTTSPSTSPASSPRNSHRLPHHNVTGHSNTYNNMTQDQFYRTRPNTGGSGKTKPTDLTGGASRHSHSSSSSSRASRGHRSGGGGSGKRRKIGGGKGGPSDWRVAGGPGRDHSVLIELELDKVRVRVMLCF